MFRHSLIGKNLEKNVHSKRSQTKKCSAKLCDSIYVTCQNRQIHRNIQLIIDWLGNGE